MSSRTFFNGVWYKSRLEAHWAAFFDEVGIEVQYEPRTFPLRAGWYVPDFWMRRYNLWVEIKGDFDLYLARRYAELANSTCNPVLVFMGTPLPARYVASLFPPTSRFAENYPELTNAKLAGYQWDQKTLWLLEGDRYMKMRRQWERQHKRSAPPIDNCRWIAEAMNRALEKLDRGAKQAVFTKSEHLEFFPKE